MNAQPPEECPGEPELETLNARVPLFRIHSAQYQPAQFNPTPSHPLYGGGRFDSTPNAPYGFLYAGSDDHCAVAETLLRDVPLHDRSARILLKRNVEERRLSCISCDRDLELVKLYGLGLPRIGQSTWLTGSDAADYPYTRDWAQAIRMWVPAAQGFVWRSAKLNDRSAFVFFDDRCQASWFSELPHPALGPSSGNPGGHPLDEPPGLPYLKTLLVDFGCTIA